MYSIYPIYIYYVYIYIYIYIQHGFISILMPPKKERQEVKKKTNFLPTHPSKSTAGGVSLPRTRGNKEEKKNEVSKKKKRGVASGLR